MNRTVDPDDLTPDQRAAMTAALAHPEPAPGEVVRQALSDAQSISGHNHQPLIHERLRRVEVRMPAIVRRLLDAEADANRLRASAEGAQRRIGEALDYLAEKDATKLSEDAGAMGFHIVAVLDGPGLTAAERAEQRAKDDQRRAAYAEAVATVARLEEKRVALERIANAERESAAELGQQLDAARATAALASEYRLPVNSGGWLEVSRDPNGDRWGIAHHRYVITVWSGEAWTTLDQATEDGTRWSYDSAESALTEATRLAETIPAAW
jgi:hypothetical protein